jgi:hypothetical protein
VCGIFFQLHATLGPSYCPRMDDFNYAIDSLILLSFY